MRVTPFGGSSDCLIMPMNDAVDQVLKLPGRAGRVEHGDDGAGKSNETGLHRGDLLSSHEKTTTNAQERQLKGVSPLRWRRVDEIRGARLTRMPCPPVLLRYPVE